MKFQFIEEHLQQFSLETACGVLEVSRSGYYAWRDRPRSQQANRREELAAKIQAVHQENRGVWQSASLPGAACPGRKCLPEHGGQGDAGSEEGRQEGVLGRRRRIEGFDDGRADFQAWYCRIQQSQVSL